MFKSILEKKSLYFTYCIVTYVALYCLVIALASPLFSSLIAQSLPATLIGYFLAKNITQFKKVRMLSIPFMFILVQFSSTFLSLSLSYTYSLGQNSGTAFAGFNLGISLILFVAMQLVIKFKQKKLALA